MGMPTIVPMPSFVVKTVFGEMGEEVLLGGVGCKPERLEKEGFKWEYEGVGETLRWAVGK